MTLLLTLLLLLLLLQDNGGSLAWRELGGVNGDLRCGKGTMRAELIGHFQPCMTDIYLHIDARMSDYIRTHP